MALSPSTGFHKASWKSSCCSEPCRWVAVRWSEQSTEHTCGGLLARTFNVRHVEMSLCASADEGQRAGLWGHTSLLVCSSSGGEGSLVTFWGGWTTQTLWAHSTWAQNISAAETSPAAASKVGVSPVQCWAVGPVHWFGGPAELSAGCSCFNVIGFWQIRRRILSCAGEASQMKLF